MTDFIQIRTQKSVFSAVLVNWGVKVPHAEGLRCGVSEVIHADAGGVDAGRLWDFGTG